MSIFHRLFSRPLPTPRREINRLDIGPTEDEPTRLALIMEDYFMLKVFEENGVVTIVGIVDGVVDAQSVPSERLAENSRTAVVVRMSRRESTE